MHIYFTWRNLFLNSTQQKKRKGHRARFRENDDLPLLLRGAAVIKKAPFFNAPALVTREIMRNRDAQCNTGEWS